MRLHRLIAILLLIESRGKMKAKELAIALETSVRSIYRDIDALSQAGIPIAATSGPSGGIYLMEGYTVNLKHLYVDDVVHLYLTGMGIHVGQDTETGHKLTSALLKLEKTLPQTYRPDIEKAKKRFYFDETPWWEERVVIPHLEVLRAAVWRSSKVVIAYRKMDGSSSSRTVCPYGLVVKKTEWYLVAYCENAQEIRTFKCERIPSVHVLEEACEIPESFSLAGYWTNQEAAFKQACREVEYFPVVIRLHAEKLAVRERLEVISAVQQGDYEQLTVNLYSYERACRDILDMIGHMEVVEPAELRTFAKERLRERMALYK
ncbi:helix-turn-helix transcriptional regulator [Brevibacillus porteri]|uniref:helix-turn-helix transcriptional regulator n=1 Tax=Brevibacillus porteri TaxID=2126350 RepID=UPI003D219343